MSTLAMALARFLPRWQRARFPRREVTDDVVVGVTADQRIRIERIFADCYPRQRMVVAGPPRRATHIAGRGGATTAMCVARMHAQDEALRREAWRNNAPVRAAAADLSTWLDGRP